MPYEFGTVIIPILQIRKWKYRKVKWIAHGCIAGKW